MTDRDEYDPEEARLDDDFDRVAPRKKKATRVSYKARVGLSYGEDKRAEAGDVVDDLPEDSVEWLLANGSIEKVED